MKKYLNILYILLIIIILLIILYYNNYKILEKYENPNPKILLINYANKGFVNSRKEQKETALSIAGIHEVIEYNFDDIDDEFKEECSQHFSQSRGAGYWVWKPYLILKTLYTMNEGDILVYCDAGANFRGSILPSIEKMQGSIMLFYYDAHESEKKWTKKDIFLELNALENSDVLDIDHVESGFLILKKSSESIDFINKWLELCKNYHLVSDEPSNEPNFPEFIENRHDQSLLSVLGKVYKNTYNIMFDDKPFINHHRSRA